MRAMRLLGTLLALAALLSACRSAVVCGDGTELVGSECRPTSLMACGGGTVASDGGCLPEVVCGADTVVSDGRCVPTFACGPGTVASSGVCIPASVITCGPGTDEVAGVCQPADLVQRTTVPEGGEPNGLGGRPTRFALPAIGAPPAVLGGIVDRPTTAGADFDGFVFTGRRLQRLHLEAKALGAPAVSFSVHPCKLVGTVCDPDPARPFPRYALRADSRDTERDVVLPFDGEYLVLVSETANVIGEAARGAATFSYTVDVTQLAQPAPQPLTMGFVQTGDSDTYVGHAFTVTADAPLYEVTLAPPSQGFPFPGRRALWASDNSKLLLDLTDDEATNAPMRTVRTVFPPGRHQIFVDDVFRAGSPPRYALTVTPVPVVPGPTTTTPQRGDVAFPGEALSFIELNGGELAELSVDLSGFGAVQISLPRLELRDESFKLVASANALSLSHFVPVSGGGRYFVTVIDQTWTPTKTQTAFTLRLKTSPVTIVGPVGVAPTTALPTQAVGGDGHAWYAVYAAHDSMLSVSARPAADVNVSMRVFGPALTSALANLDAGDSGVAETTQAYEVTAGAWLLVSVDGATGSAFTLSATATATTRLSETEPNNTPTTAMPVDLSSGKLSIAGSFSDAGDVDCIGFMLTETKYVTAVTGVGTRLGVADTYLRFFISPSRYYRNDDALPTSVLSSFADFFSPGNYWVCLNRSGKAAADSASDYLLTLTAQ
ncbi:MAG: hypothetical protein RL199_1571 [Pseudomonadota bacterium]|jgi:hypothetical protein